MLKSDHRQGHTRDYEGRMGHPAIDGPEDRRNAQAALIVLCAWVIAIVIVAGTTLLLISERNSRIEVTQEHTASVASMIATDIGSNIKIYDALLRDMVNAAEDPSTPTMSNMLRERLRFGKAVSRDLLDVAYVIDAEGHVSAALDGAPEAMRLDDRDYYFAQTDEKTAGLYLSHPFMPRVDQTERSVALSRRISRDDGSFAGVAMLAFRLGEFQRFVQGVSSDDFVDSLQVVREDGTVLVSSRPDAGSSVQDATWFAGNAQRRATQTGEQIARVPGIAAYVVATPALNKTLSRWRKQAAITGSISAALIFTLVVGSTWLARTVRARDRALLRLAQLSRTDGLTGLYNRRALDARLLEDWGRARRSGEPVSVLFIDIDKFKLFNDHYGHETGDEVLRKVATRIAAHARRNQDMAARFVGAEFAVVLPGAGAAEAMRMAELIRQDVAQLHIDHVLSDTGAVTVSIGCATATAEACDDVHDVVRAADAQMLDAKAAGRNRVRAVTLGNGVGARDAAVAME